MDELEINTLHRFAKHSPGLILEQHSACEVPAGCGGIVMRWVNPARQAYLLFTLVNAGKAHLYLDGREVHSAAFTVPVGPHVLALHLESSASFILSAERDPEPQARLLFCSLADDSWRATDQTPPDNWNQPDFSADWPALQECEATPEVQQRWGYPRLTQTGARSLGRPGAGPLWVRKHFELTA